MSDAKGWWKKKDREFRISVSGLSQRGDMLRELLAVIDRLTFERDWWQSERCALTLTGPGSDQERLMIKQCEADFLATQSPEKS